MNRRSGNAESRPGPPSAAAVIVTALCLTVAPDGAGVGAEPGHAFGPSSADSLAGALGQHPVDRPLGDAFMASLRRRGALHSVVIEGRPRWWLDTEPQPDGRWGSSDLVFETRMDGRRLGPFITCATCHDRARDLERISLRLPNRGGGLCRACHDR